MSPNISRILISLVFLMSGWLALAVNAQTGSGVPVSPGTTSEAATAVVAPSAPVPPTTASKLPAGTATGVQGGLCIVVPATDGAGLAALSGEGRFVVQGLAPATVVDSVRASIPTPLAGLVSAQTWTPGKALPYADNLVDLLVVDRDALGSGGPADDELLRCVAPEHGAIWLKAGGAWKKLTKPMPATFGEWTHYWCSATGNPVSKDQGEIPTGIQWIADSPSGGENHGGNQLAADGLFYSTNKDYLAYLGGNWNREIMRGAFNGIARWEIAWKGNVQPVNRFDPIAIVDGRVYRLRDRVKGPVVAVDAATGKEIQEYKIPGLAEALMRKPAGADKEWGQRIGMSPMADALIVWRGDSAWCVDQRSGALRWSYSAGGKPVEYFVLDPVNRRVGLLLGLDVVAKLGDNRSATFKPGEVASLDLVTGKEVWRVPYPFSGSNTSGFLWADGIYYTHQAATLGPNKLNIAAINAKDGSTAWTKEWDKKNVWIGSLMVYPQAVVVARSGVAMFHPKSGEQIGMWNTVNSRCDASRGNAFGFANFGHYFRFDGTGTAFHARRNEVARNECGGANVPAYGMYYYTPQNCGCFTAVRGLVALNSQKLPEPVPDAARLERGPAAALKPALVESAGDWTALLKDNARSAGGTPLKRAALNEVWRVRLETGDQPGAPANDWRTCAHYNGPISAPVAAGGLVIVTAPDAHRIHAVDAATGAKKWTFTAGGRVDTPPTVSGGRVYAGCRDGYLYCLDLATGELVWRFLAAPSRMNIVAWDQPESAWPVHGAVVVANGIVAATAGYHPDTDGGIACWGLDAATGAVRWKRQIASNRTTVGLDPGIPGTPGDYATPNKTLAGVPSSDGAKLSLAGVQLNLADGAPEKLMLGGEGGGKKRGSEKPSEPSHGLWVAWGNKGMNQPWLRSAYGSFGGPGSSGERQSYRVSGTDTAVSVEGRRFAWDPKRLGFITKDSLALSVWDRSGPISFSGEARDEQPETRKTTGKEIAFIKFKTGAMAKFEGKASDPVALLFAGDRAVACFVQRTPALNRPQAILKIADLNGKEPEVELIVKPAIIEHGLATAQGILFASLEDGSLVAYK